MHLSAKLHRKRVSGKLRADHPHSWGSDEALLSHFVTVPLRVDDMLPCGICSQPRPEIVSHISGQEQCEDLPLQTR
jgi:hypothetical protein